MGRAWLVQVEQLTENSGTVNFQEWVSTSKNICERNRAGGEHQRGATCNSMIFACGVIAAIVGILAFVFVLVRVFVRQVVGIAMMEQKAGMKEQEDRLKAYTRKKMYIVYKKIHEEGEAKEAAKRENEQRSTQIIVILKSGERIC
jgi:hypothetical protein